jgi:hypothetical protein
LAITTLGIELPSFPPIPSMKLAERGEREDGWNGGMYSNESCLVRAGELDLVGLSSMERIACTKSSREVSSKTSTVAWDRPKTLSAI